MRPIFEKLKNLKMHNIICQSSQKLITELDIQIKKCTVTYVEWIFASTKSLYHFQIPPKKPKIGYTFVNKQNIQFQVAVLMPTFAR